MNMMTTIARFARLFHVNDSQEDSHGGSDMRFSVGGKLDLYNTVLTINEIVDLIEKHKMELHPNLIKFIVDVEAIVRARIAEKELPQQPKEQD